MAPKTFADAVEASRAALAAMAKGDPGPTLALWSRGDDIVLNNPLGPPIVGFAAVSAETERVATMFVGGGSFGFEEITRVVGDDLGYVVTIERAQVQRVRTDKRAPPDLRVTTAFRREDDGWHLCLRHADRVTTAI